MIYLNIEMTNSLKKQLTTTPDFKSIDYASVPPVTYVETPPESTVLLECKILRLLVNEMSEIY